MLTQPQVQRYAIESGLRDIMIAEKEVVLTFLLQLLSCKARGADGSDRLSESDSATTRHSLRTKRPKLCRSGKNFRAVVETGVPVATTLRSEVHKVPDRSEQVDAALFDLGSHPRMR